MAAAPDWITPFLAALALSGNVRQAAKAAGITRQNAYLQRKASKTFAKQWDGAMDEAVEVLEAEARRRAMTSSDTLMIFLLKAHRPEVYRETTKHEVSGPDNGPIPIQQIIVEIPEGSPA